MVSKKKDQRASIIAPHTLLEPLAAPVTKACTVAEASVAKVVVA